MPFAADSATPAEFRGRRQLKGAFAIELDRIRPDPTQPRQHVEDDSLDALASSLRRHGVIPAISGRSLAENDIYQSSRGERRYRAARLAGLTAIPCVIHDPDRDQVLVRQIVENWQRAQLHPFEIADALNQLRETNRLSQKELAEATGKPEAEISKFLKLVELDPAIQKEARNDPTGVLSFRHLYNLARLEPAHQVAIASAVREQRLSAIDTELLVSKHIERRTARPRRGSTVTKIEYATAKAKVVLTFRKQVVEAADILAALDEARAKAEAKTDTLNIVRAK